SAKPPPLEGLSPSHGAFQGHAAHLAEWSATLRPTGSSSTCIPEGVSTFFHAAFTAHREARADAGSRRLQPVVRRRPRRYRSIRSADTGCRSFTLKRSS